MLQALMMEPPSGDIAAQWKRTDELESSDSTFIAVQAPDGELPTSSKDFAPPVELCEQVDTERRCLITLASELDFDIDRCHLIREDTIGTSVLRRLEYYWGVNCGELNLDSDENFIDLGIPAHKAFDNGNFALFPTVGVLQDILSICLKLGSKPTKSPWPHYKTICPLPEYEYHLVPLRWLLNPVNVCRHLSTDECETYGNYLAPCCRRYHLPSNNPPFPKLRSRANPFFVLANSLTKEASLYCHAAHHMGEEYRYLFPLVAAIHGIWRAPPPTCSLPGSVTGTIDRGGAVYQAIDRLTAVLSHLPTLKRRGSACSHDSPKKRLKHHSQSTSGEIDRLRMVGHPSSSSRRQMMDDLRSGAEEAEASEEQFEQSCILVIGWRESVPATSTDTVDHQDTSEDKLATSTDSVNHHDTSDDKLAAYQTEPSRPPRTKSWVSWDIAWRSSIPPDTSRFSSNDWAAWRAATFITR